MVWVPPDAGLAHKPPKLVHVCQVVADCLLGLTYRHLDAIHRVAGAAYHHNHLGALLGADQRRGQVYQVGNDPRKLWRVGPLAGTVQVQECHVGEVHHHELAHAGESVLLLVVVLVGCKIARPHARQSARGLLVQVRSVEHPRHNGRATRVVQVKQLEVDLERTIVNKRGGQRPGSLLVGRGAFGPKPPANLREAHVVDAHKEVVRCTARHIKADRKVSRRLDNLEGHCVRTHADYYRNHTRPRQVTFNTARHIYVRLHERRRWSTPPSLL